MSVEDWGPRLEAAIAARGHQWRVEVAESVASTQEEARRRGLTPGTLLTAGRQLRGRGRHGRSWSDGGGAGIAISFVLDDEALPWRAIGAAVGVAEAVEKLIDAPVGIKWPNDVLVGGCKLAGVLIEVAAGRAVVGVGVNVERGRWPTDVAPRVTSLADLGAEVDRLDALMAIVPSILDAWARPAEALTEAFDRRDLVTAHPAVIRCGNRTISGTVRAIEPVRGLAIETSRGTEWFHAANTTLLRLPDLDDRSASGGPTTDLIR